jgi:hypothetical protein
MQHLPFGKHNIAHLNTYSCCEICVSFTSPFNLTVTLKLMTVCAESLELSTYDAAKSPVSEVSHRVNQVCLITNDQL